MEVGCCRHVTIATDNLLGSAEQQVLAQQEDS